MRYEFDAFSVDTDARQLRRGTEAVHLSPKALELLTILIESRGRALSKQEIHDRLWPDTFVADANLPVLIREIRRAVDDTRREVIRTVHRTGYAFERNVREIKGRRGEPASAPGCIHLILLQNEQRRLVEGENLVGREPDADVFLASSSVSRRHAVIAIDGERATLTDLGSKNGTFIGTIRVAEPSVLESEIKLRFGDVIVRYRRCAAAVETDTLTDSDLPSS